MTEHTLTDSMETRLKFVRIMDGITELLYPEYSGMSDEFFY